MQSSRDDVSSSSDNEQMNEQEAALKVAYDRYSNAISKLFDLAEDSSNHEQCEEVITMMRNVMDNLTMLTPSEGWVGKKGPYDFQVTADWLAYSERWYGEGKAFTEKEALEEAYYLKHDLESGDLDRLLTEEQSKLVGLFANSYEKAQVELHCAELTSALSVYEQAALNYFFNNDPFELGDKLHKDVRQCAEQYGISTASCDIFEETLLRLAGVEPSQLESEVLGFPICTFSSFQNPGYLTLSLRGHSKDEMKRFVDYLKDITKDDSVSHEVETGPKCIDLNIIKVNIGNAAQYLVPVFRDELQRLAYENPALLDKYVDKKSVLRDHDVDGQIDAFTNWAWKGVCSAANSAYSFFAGPAGSPAASQNRTPEPTPENSPATPRR